MIYAALLRNHWKSFSRSVLGKRSWLVTLGLIPLIAYFVFVLIGLGYFFGRLFAPTLATGGARVLLNAHMLAILSGTLGMRFFFQRPPRMEIGPYLHLPIRRNQLLRYFQAASLISVHNFYPLLFFVPFCMRYVIPVQGWETGIIWLLGIVCCLLITHYLNTVLRVMVERYARVMLALALLLVAAQMVDTSMGTGVTHELSSLVFNRLATGDLVILAELAVILIATVLISTQALRLNLHAVRSGGAQRRRATPFNLSFGRSPIPNLILLELMMMWRNKRSKQYVLISVGVSTAYTALLLSDFNALFGNVMAAAVGLFASGVFALNYGQLMFAWESRYFDGLIARDLKPQHMVLAKFMVLQGSCLVLFLVSLPLFIWLARELLMLHVAFLFYNAGVTSILMLLLAVYNRKRVNASEGSFFNYQGFSVMHWLWIIPTIIPPAVLMYLLEGTPGTALSLIAALGLVSMLLAWPSSKFIARVLTRRKYVMATGFRSYDH
ncbi:MAG TPA: DUF5687 family protein [Rhodothermales bacterium]|nr:DUF5687 family protein [Rhodothermales bacterium]